MRPNDRPRAPGEGWSIDLITNLEPECDGYHHCVIAVDCFSKWVEIMPLRDKRSSTLEDWLYREIIPRFGKPRWLRCDSGREFMGAFKALCEELGITLRFVSSGRPEANGQVERVNREIKRSIRRYALLHPTTAWFDWIPEVLVGLRMVV